MKFISSILTAASGSVAGSTYSRNANGAYIRNKAVPTNVNSLAQQAARAKFSNASTGWRGLTSVQKESWSSRVIDYPYVDSLGQSKTYTASQLYKKLNGTLLQSNLSVINTCENPVTLIQIAGASIIADVSLSTVAFDVFEFIGGIEDVPANTQLNIYATQVQGPGVTNPKESIFKFLGGLSATTEVATADINTIYSAIFGSGWAIGGNIGSNIWFGFKLVSTITGQSYSAMYMASAPIIA